MVYHVLSSFSPLKLPINGHNWGYTETMFTPSGSQDLYPDQRQIWLDSHFGHFDRIATVFWCLEEFLGRGPTGDAQSPVGNQVIISDP